MNETITTQLAMPVSAANPQEHGRQNRWTVLYHWFSVFGLLIAVASILLRLAVEDKTLRIELLTIHRQAGLFVLLVLALRLGTRLKIGVRDFAPDLRRTLRVAAKVAHVGLYLLLLVLTLLGWATTNAHAVGLNLFGVLPLPNL